jgi:hypothetical protein
VLHDEEEPVGCLDNLVQLDYMRVAHNLQYMDLSGYALDIIHIGDFVFLEDFDCNLK